MLRSTPGEESPLTPELPFGPEPEILAQAPFPKTDPTFIACCALDECTACSHRLFRRGFREMPE